MVRCAGRLRRLWGALAGAMLAALAACGGGGGGGGSGSAAPSGGTGGSTPESTYLLAEFVAKDSNHQFVRVWDPAHPDVAVQDVQIVVTNGIVWTSSHLMFSDATRYDASARQVTSLGHARVFYDNGGKLFTMDLRGGQSHAPVQLSSATDVFTTVAVFPMSADGADAWIDAQGGTHDWAIRTTMAAADAPVDVLRIAAPMRDATSGLPQYFLLSHGHQDGTHISATTFQVVDGAFDGVSEPTVATMDARDQWLGADPAQAGLGYLRIGGALRALRWSAGALAVDAASAYTFSNPLGALPGVADAASLYLNDGLSLLAVTNGAVRTIGSFSTAPGALVDAGTHVAASEAVSTAPTTTQVETLRKADGALTLVEAAAPGLQVLGAGGQSLVIVGTSEAGQAFVLASGDNQARQTAGSQFVGLVRAASRLLDQPAAPVALLSCPAASTAGYCAAGALTQLDLSTPASATTLGTLGTTSAWMRDDLVAGLVSSFGGQSFLSASSGFGSNQVDVRDAWQVTAGTGASLARVTSVLP